MASYQLVVPAKKVASYQLVVPVEVSTCEEEEDKRKEDEDYTCHRNQGEGEGGRGQHLRVGVEPTEGTHTQKHTPTS